MVSGHNWDEIFSTTGPTELGLDDTERNQHLVDALANSASCWVYSDTGDVMQVLERLQARDLASNVVVVDLTQQPSYEDVLATLGMTNDGGTLHSPELVEQRPMLIIRGFDDHIRRTMGRNVNDQILRALRIAGKRSGGMMISCTADFDSVDQLLRATMESNYWARDIDINFTFLFQVR